MYIEKYLNDYTKYILYTIKRLETLQFRITHHSKSLNTESWRNEGVNLTQQLIDKIGFTPKDEIIQYWLNLSDKI